MYLRNISVKEYVKYVVLYLMKGIAEIRELASDPIVTPMLRKSVNMDIIFSNPVDRLFYLKNLLIWLFV